MSSNPDHSFNGSFVSAGASSKMFKYKADEKKKSGNKSAVRYNLPNKDSIDHSHKEK